MLSRGSDALHEPAAVVLRLLRADDLPAVLAIQRAIDKAWQTTTEGLKDKARAALWLLGAISTLTLFALAVLYRPLVMECVDPLFLRTVSRAGGPAHYAFLGLVVVNLVAGFQALGTLLAVGLMLLPAITARFWARGLGGLIAVAMLLGTLASFGGLVLSYHLDLPSGPAIVLVAGLIYLVSMLAGPRGGLLRRLVRPRHLEA